MVLATGLAFFMLWFGGGGGLINMSYAMNAMIHNTSWVTAHFHLIFGGTVVIMYFAIAYEIWPHLTGRTRASHRRAAPAAVALGDRHDGDDASLALARASRANGGASPHFDYSDPSHRRLGALGGCVGRGRRRSLLASAVLFIANLARFHGEGSVALVPVPPQRFAMAVHPPARVAAPFNGFGSGTSWCSC